MADYPTFVLSGRSIRASYGQLVQHTGSVLVGSDGNVVKDLGTYATTASLPTAVASSSWSSQSLNAFQAVSASLADEALTALVATDAIFATDAAEAETASIATSASYALSASWAPYIDTVGTTLYTGSTYEITSSWSEKSALALGANNVYVAEDTSSNDAQPVWFSAFAGVYPGNNVPLKGTLTFNPSTQTLTANNFAGTASSATSASWAPAVPFDGTSSALRVTSPYSNAIQVGNSLPLYLSSGWPTIAFNGYYNNSLSNWVFGPGSSNNWAAFQDFNVGSGQVEFYFSTAPGTSGSTWNTIQTFAISHDGMVKMPLLPDGVLIVNSTNVTSSTDLTSLGVSASYASYAPTVGLTTTQSWVDAATLLTQSMYIANGLIISWSVAP